MDVLSDRIENFIKEIMADGMALIGRNDLAVRFRCAPSQINYVLTTRFSPDRGYTVESKRGGGGYIKIMKLSPDRNAHIGRLAESIPDEGLSERTLNGIMACLIELGYADETHARMINSMLCDKSLGAVKTDNKDVLRSHLVRQMLRGMLR